MTAALLVLPLGACGDPAIADAEPPGSTATTVIDGIVIHLTLDRATVEPGAAIRAIVTVRNLGRDPVPWRAGGCELRSSITVAPTPPDMRPTADPAGRSDIPRTGDAVGDRRVARFIASLADPADAVAAPVTQVDRSAAGDRSCQIDHGFAVLGPGEEIEERAAWPATTAAGVPLPPGGYEVLASFPRLRGATPLVPADFRGDRDLAPVEAGIGIAIEAAGPAHPSAAEAVAAMLAATALDGWVRAGSISAVDGALAYDASGWSLTVRLPTGGTATARVGPDGRADPELRFAP